MWWGDGAPGWVAGVQGACEWVEGVEGGVHPDGLGVAIGRGAGGGEGQQVLQELMCRGEVLNAGVLVEAEEATVNVASERDDVGEKRSGWARDDPS